MSKRKIFIDTDCGTDDAIALMMALRHQDVNVIGISTSGGNVALEKVIQNVLYVRELCGSQTPVYHGAAQPLQRSLGTADFIHGIDGLGDIGIDLSGRVADPGLGSERIIHAVESNPGEIEIICLGPLTNLSLAISSNPGLMNQVKKVYIMGGLISLPGNVTPLAEYNIWADPEAADMVLHGNTRITMIGWDTTLKCSNLTLKELEEIRNINTKYAIFAADIQGIRVEWMKQNSDAVTVNIADALAMAVALNDHLVTHRSPYLMRVKGGEDHGQYRGFIEAISCSDSDGIDYVHQVDRHGYLELLRDCLSEGNHRF